MAETNAQVSCCSAIPFSDRKREIVATVYNAGFKAGRGFYLGHIRSYIVLRFIKIQALIMRSVQTVHKKTFKIFLFMFHGSEWWMQGINVILIFFISFFYVDIIYNLKFRWKFE